MITREEMNKILHELQNVGANLALLKQLFKHGVETTEDLQHKLTALWNTLDKLTEE